MYARTHTYAHTHPTVRVAQRLPGLESHPPSLPPVCCTRPAPFSRRCPVLARPCCTGLSLPSSCRQLCSTGPCASVSVVPPCHDRGRLWPGYAVCCLEGPGLASAVLVGDKDIGLRTACGQPRVLTFEAGWGDRREILSPTPSNERGAGTGPIALSRAFRHRGDSHMLWKTPSAATGLGTNRPLLENAASLLSCVLHVPGDAPRRRRRTRPALPHRLGVGTSLETGSAHPSPTRPISAWLHPPAPGSAHRRPARPIGARLGPPVPSLAYWRLVRPMGARLWLLVPGSPTTAACALQKSGQAAVTATLLSSVALGKWHFFPGESVMTPSFQGARRLP